MPGDCVLILKGKNMRALSMWAGVLSCAALLVACAREKHKVFDNPADPQSTAYVGHEVRDPNDPINVPWVEITKGPTTIKINVMRTYAATAIDPNPRGLQAGWIVRYDWDFGDGTKLPDASPREEHTFTTAGAYLVRVTVADDDGNTRSDSVQVTVTNLPPIAHPFLIYVTYPMAGPGINIMVNTPVEFRGTGSDPDGCVVKYEWDFDGDGAYDWSSPSTGETTYTYADTGAYTAELRVTDDDGNTGTAQVQVHVWVREYSHSLPPRVIRP